MALGGGLACMLLLLLFLISVRVVEGGAAPPAGNAVNSHCLLYGCVQSLGC